MRLSNTASVRPRVPVPKEYIDAELSLEEIECVAYPVMELYSAGRKSRLDGAQQRMRVTLLGEPGVHPLFQRDTLCLGWQTYMLDRMYHCPKHSSSAVGKQSQSIGSLTAVTIWLTRGGRSPFMSS